MLTETQEHLILKRRDIRINGSKPCCPKCKLEHEVIITNVTLNIYECLKCKLKFALSD